MQTNRGVWSGVLAIMLASWVLVLYIQKGIGIVRHLQATNKSRTRMGEDWGTLVRNRAPLLGSANAGFKIVEFSDYQCPYCRIADPILVHFYSQHPNDVVVYRYDLPLQQIHPYSFLAAIAANCAELQGVKEPYQSLLFSHQKQFATVDWVSLARQAGVSDGGKFARCMKDDVPDRHVKQDVSIAQAMQIESTPSILVNGSLIQGPITEERLEILFGTHS